MQVNIDATGAKSGASEANRALDSMAQQAVKSVTAIERVQTSLNNAGAALTSYGTQTDAAAAKTHATAASFSSLSSMGTRLRGVLASLGVGLSIAGFIRLARSAVDTASTLVETADRIGITVEQLQELQYAASQSGVSTQVFGQAMENLSVRLAQAVAGTGKTKDVLKAFKLDAEVLAKDPARAVTVLADKIASLGTQAERLSAARAFFGPIGDSLVNMLQQGGPAIDTLRQKLRDLGGVMSDETARAAEQMGDDFETVALALGTQLKVAIVEILPLLVRLGDFAVGAAQGITHLLQTAGLMDTPLKTELQEVSKRIFDIQRQIEGIQDRAPGKNVVSQYFQESEKNVAALTERLGPLLARQKELQEQFAKSAPVVKRVAGEMEEFGSASDKTAKHFDDLIKRTREHAETMNLKGVALADYLAKQAKLDGANDTQVKQLHAAIMLEENAKAAKEAHTKAIQDQAEAQREATRIAKEAEEARIGWLMLENKLAEAKRKQDAEDDAANAKSMAQLDDEIAALQEESRLMAAQQGPKDKLRALELEITKERIRRGIATERAALGEHMLVEGEETRLQRKEDLLIANAEIATSYAAIGEAAKTAALTTDDLKTVVQGILSGTQNLPDVAEDLGQAVGLRIVDGILFGKGQNEGQILENFNSLLGIDMAGLFATQGQSLGSQLVSSIVDSLGMGGKDLLAGMGVDVGSLFGMSAGEAASITWEQGAADLFNFKEGGVPMASAQAGGTAFGEAFGAFAAGAAGIALGQGLAGIMGKSGKGSMIGGGIGAVGGGIIGTFFGSPQLGAAVGGMFGSLLGGIIGSLFSHTPTKGTQIRKGVKDFLKDIEASFASEIDSGEYFFEETKKLAEKMFGGSDGNDFLKASKVILNDKIGPELARQLQALGTFITADQAKKLGKSVEQTGTTFGNLMLDNLGLDPEVIDDAIQEIVQKANISFSQLVTKLNSLFEKNQISAEFYTDTIAGAVAIFNRDLPEAINVSAIALRSFGEDGIFDLEKFQTALEQVTATFEMVATSFVDTIKNAKPGEDVGRLLGEQIEKGLEDMAVDAFLASFVKDQLFAGIDLSNGLDADELALIEERARAARVEVEKLWDIFGETGKEVDDVADKVDDLFEKIRRLTQERFDLRINVLSDLESIGAVSATQVAQARIGAGQATLAGLGAATRTDFTDLELEAGLEAIRDLRAATVDLFRAQEAAANDALERRITEINEDFAARQKSLEREAELAQDLADARIKAIGLERDAVQQLFQERLDGLQEELQVAQDFRRVSESLQSTITQLVTSTQRFTGPEQIAIFEAQADQLRQRIAGAAGSERANLIDQLSQVLNQQLGAANEVMDPTQFRASFDAVVHELETLRDQTAMEGDRTEELQIAIAQTTAQMNIQLAAIDAAIEQARMDAESQQREFAAQAELLSEQEQMAMQTAQEATRMEINQLRMEAAMEIRNLANIEDAILAEQIARAQAAIELSGEQLNVLHSINGGIGSLETTLIQFIDTAMNSGAGTLPVGEGTVIAQGVSSLKDLTFSPVINVTNNGGNKTEGDSYTQAKAIAAVIYNEWKVGKTGVEIRQEIARKG